VNNSLDLVIETSADKIDPEAFQVAQENFNINTNHERVERTCDNFDDVIKKPKNQALGDGDNKIISDVDSIMTDVNGQRSDFAEDSTFETYKEEQQNMTINSFLNDASLRHTDPAAIVDRENINRRANL
jgi:hypothetical protein